MKRLDLETVEFVINALTGQQTVPGLEAQAAGGSALRALADRLQEVRRSIQSDLAERENLNVNGKAATGVGLIAAERRRQVDVEGWSPVHDDSHRHGEMALAAALYATPILLFERKISPNSIVFRDSWPWGREWDKRARDTGNLVPNGNAPLPHRKRHLEKAGALVAAELDRLVRIEAKNAARAVSGAR